MRGFSHCEFMRLVFSVMFSMVRSLRGGIFVFDGSIFSYFVDI